jgi:tetrahydromethanopterin S-methyltransferase subunit G
MSSDARLEAINRRLRRIERQLDHSLVEITDALRFDAIERRLERIEAKLDDHETRISRLEGIRS